MAWQIELTETANRHLKKIGKPAARRITAFLRQRLAILDDPRSIGKALTGPFGGLWRSRVGDYRVICEIHDSALRILMVKIGNRREVYR